MIKDDILFKYSEPNTKNKEKNYIETDKLKTSNKKSTILDNSQTKSNKKDKFKRNFPFKNLSFKEVDSILLAKKNKSKINRLASPSIPEFFKEFQEKYEIFNNRSNCFPSYNDSNPNRTENQKLYQINNVTINNNTKSMENLTIIKTNDNPTSYLRKKTKSKEQSSLNTGKQNTSNFKSQMWGNSLTKSSEINFRNLPNSPRNQNSLSAVPSNFPRRNKKSKQVDRSNHVPRPNEAKSDHLVNGIVSSSPHDDNSKSTNILISARKIENQKLSSTPKFCVTKLGNDTEMTCSKNVMNLKKQKNDTGKVTLETQSNICDNSSLSTNRFSLSALRKNFDLELKLVNSDPQNIRYPDFYRVNISENQFKGNYQYHKSFVKSVIQALAGCITFRSSLIAYHSSSKIVLSEENSENKVFTSNFCKLMYDLENGRDVTTLLGNLEDHVKSISSCCNILTCFVNILSVIHNVMKMNQDVIANSLIPNKADFEFEKFRKSNDGIVFECFFGQMVHKTACETCSNFSAQFQLFNYLCISNFDTQLPKTLDSCIKTYFQKMKVVLGNPMICICNDSTISISYQCQITHSPMYLFIYLEKELFITSELKKSILITTGPTIEIKLTQGSVIYNLISTIDYDVINGQYYCKCNYETKEWWQLNDEKIMNNSRCESQDIVRDNTVAFLFKKT